MLYATDTRKGVSLVPMGFNVERSTLNANNTSRRVLAPPTGLNIELKEFRILSEAVWSFLESGIIKLNLQLNAIFPSLDWWSGSKSDQIGC